MAKKNGILLADGALSSLAALLEGEKEVYLIYDENLTAFAKEIAAAVPSIRKSIALSTSEELKTMETVLAIERHLLQADATRNALLLALGGGITTDITGFVASIYKRGVRYANIPTTLLAQVDAAIGGKTGVNLDGYKNMLGSFLQPQFSYLCQEVLRTLGQRDFLAGAAELLKTFLIADGGRYKEAVRFLDCARNDKSGARNDKSGTRNDENGARNDKELMGLIWEAAQIKAGIVERDPLEQGERTVLNLGHTFGHAIEHQAQLCGDDIRHGEAVAMGIIMAARLSEAMNIAENGLAESLVADFTSIGLPVQSPYPLDSLREAMEKDKKSAGGKVKFILPLKPGEVRIVPLSPAEACEILSKI